MKRLLFLILLGCGGAYFARAYVVEGIIIASASMEPTLPVGIRYFLNKTAYRFSSPQRGDVVVFPSPVEKKDLVKRIIGLPGDEIKIVEKDIFRNGEKIYERYVKHTRAADRLVGDNLEVGKVPPGHVFVMGDNRDESGDSRDWLDKEGKHLFFVKIADLKGRLMGTL